jgi:hypothetical protein
VVLQRAIDWAREETQRPLATIFFHVSDSRIDFNPILDVLCTATLIDNNNSLLV